MSSDCSTSKAEVQSQNCPVSEAEVQFPRSSSEEIQSQSIKFMEPLQNDLTNSDTKSTTTVFDWCNTKGNKATPNASTLTQNPIQVQLSWPIPEYLPKTIARYITHLVMVTVCIHPV